MNIFSLSKRATLTLAMAALLAACQAPPSQTPTPAQPAKGPIETTTATSQRASAVLHGTATYRERIKMSPGADVLVQLVDLQARVGVIAMTRLEDVAGPPYRFALSYDPSRLQTGGQYQVQAELIGPDGERWMQAKAPVTPRSASPVELLLMRTPGPSAPAATNDPWAQARARGVGFRAVGNEPGWFVEVGRGDAPPLHATLDYGERKIEVLRTVSLSSTHGFGGKTSDGTDVMLRIKREPCSDGMSGQAFEASAELKVGDSSYRGCGAYLD